MKLDPTRATFARAATYAPWVQTHVIGYGGVTMAAMRVVDEQGREHFWLHDPWENGGPDVGTYVRVGRRLYDPQCTSSPAHWTPSGPTVFARKAKAPA